jgi:hypothetical protein
MGPTSADERPGAVTATADTDGSAAIGEDQRRHEPEQAPHRRARRIAAGGAIVAAAVTAAIAALLATGGSKQATPRTGVPPGDTTAVVTRRTLSESSTVDGTLGYGSTLEVYDRLSGTFTWLPNVGSVIGRGGTLFRLNNLPVILMYGGVPAYRALHEGVGSGPDVTELNTNLIRLGFDPDGAITDDAEYGEATAAAVRRWQSAEGLPVTGKVELGRIVFAPGARRVTAVHVALGQDPPGSTGAQEPTATTPAAPPQAPASSPGHGTPPQGSGSHPHHPAHPSHPTHPHGHTPPHSGHPAAAKPPAPSPAKNPASHEGAKDPKGSSGEPGSGSGPGAGAGELTLSTTSTQQLVKLKVKAEQQQLAHDGESVSVTLPGGGTAHGRIVDVGTVATEGKEGEKEKGSSGANPGAEGSESATIPVTIALDHPVARLDEAPVSVELVKSIRTNVLSVPATALTATAGGGYAIEVLTNGHRSELAVTPGMFANGYVQVEGPGVREGLTVVEAQ